MIASSDATVVLVANSFNVPIFNQIWLYKNGIILENEFGGNSLFTPAAANIVTENFELLVLAERIQLKILKLERAAEIIQRVAVNIVEQLPHTPYAALGINFGFLIATEDESRFLEATKRIFLCDQHPLHDEFNEGNSLYGGYLSKDIFDARLKLHMTPTKKVGKPSLLLNFNVHKETTNAGEITQMLRNWASVHDYVDSLALKLNSAIGD